MEIKQDYNKGIFTASAMRDVPNPITGEIKRFGVNCEYTEEHVISMKRMNIDYNDLIRKNVQDELTRSIQQYEIDEITKCAEDNKNVSHKDFICNGPNDILADICLHDVAFYSLNYKSPIVIVTPSIYSILKCSNSFNESKAESSGISCKKYCGEVCVKWTKDKIVNMHLYCNQYKSWKHSDILIYDDKNPKNNHIIKCNLIFN